MHAITAALVVAALQVLGQTAAGQVAGKAEAVMLPRTASSGVRIVQEGVGCTIIHPAADPQWRGLADRIANQVKKLGAGSVTVLADTQAVPERLAGLPSELCDRPLILLGDLNSNRAIFPFYANYYTYCDAVYPGEDGYVLQTIVRPFGQASNCLVVGGSSFDGARAGAERLIERLSDLQAGRDVELPYCLDVKLGARLESILQPIVASALQQENAPEPPPLSADKSSGPKSDDPAGGPDDGIDYGLARDRFTSYAHLYFYTGRDELAERARDWGVYLVRREKGIRIADYTMEALAAAWRRVSPAPAFNAEQRRLIDGGMYETARRNASAWWRQKGAIPEIGGRHHTTGMLAWWTLLRCLQELGQPNEAAEAQLLQWRGEAEGYLDGLLRHYWDDLDDYQSADSAQITASYALQSGKLEWYTNGLARRAAQKLLSLTDNMGWYVGVQGYGEALPGWERFTLDGGLLLGSCAFVYEDGSYQWLLERFEEVASSWGALQPWGLHCYATGGKLEHQQPAWLTGMQILPLTPYRVDLLNDGVFLASPLMDGFAVAGLRPPGIRQELAYDKAVFRSSATPDGTFLLLQGMSGIALSTIDMNAIVRYTDQGRIWLVHNTGRMSLFFKNAVYVSNGLNDEAVPAACELLAHADRGRVKMVSSHLPDYRGTDWTRSVLACGEDFTIVIDEIEALRPDQYTVSCNWRTPGWAEMEGEAWISRQDDVTFKLLPGELANLDSNRFSSNDGATRPTVLRQNRQFKAAPADKLFFENLLYTTSPRRSQACSVRRVAPGVLAVRHQAGANQRTMLAFAKSNGVELPGFSTDAIVGSVGAEFIELLNATYVKLGDTDDLAITSNRRGPLTVQLDGNRPEWSRRVAKLLESCWANGKEPSANHVNENVSQPDQAPNGLQPAWTHAGPSVRGPLIDGIQIAESKNLEGSTLLVTDGILPALVAEPRLSPQRGSGLTFEPPKHVQRSDADADGGFSDLQPVLDPLAGSELTVKLPQPTRVGEITLIGRTAGSTPEPMPPATLRVELTFTNDGFAADLRTRTLSLERKTRYHNLYKGHAYAFATYQAQGLNEPASALRIRMLEGPSGVLPLNDLQVRAAEPVGDQPVELRVIDLDGDGNDELMSWTRQGGLAIVNSQGAALWSRDFNAGIVAVDAWDLENDGRKEVFVSLLDWRVLVINLDGSPRWEVSWADMKAKTDGRFYSDGSLVYGMAAWQPENREGKEVLLTSYYFAARLDSQGKLIDIFRRSGHFTQIREIPDGLPDAGALVTRSDIPWTGPVPLEWLDPRTGKASASVNVPNGPAVLVEVADFNSDGRSEGLVATEQGIGLYSPHEPHSLWEHRTEAALTGAAVLKPSAAGPNTFVYARQDGYLFVVDLQGRVLRKTLLDEPIQCLAALHASDGSPVVVVGTSRTLRCLSLNDLTERRRQPGSYQDLAVSRSNGSTSLIAVTTTGQIRCYRP